MAELPPEPGEGLSLVAGALMTTAAVAFLALAAAPWRAAANRFELARKSTRLPPAPRAREPLALHLLRRLTARAGVGAHWVTNAQLIEAGVDPEVVTPADLATLKVLTGAVLASLAALGVAGGASLVFVPVAAWLGFVAPSVYLRRRRTARQAAIVAEIPDVLGLLRAFTNASVALEQALHLVARQLAEADPNNILAAELRVAMGDYGLGETIERSLERMAARTGVDELRTFAAAIAQGKRVGAGMEHILRDQELLVRMGQRNRATAAASRVSTRLMAVMVAVYLPEFVILVMVPLFWGVMVRAFG